MSLTPRPLTVGPSTGPEAPFPLRMEGKVIRGFGRGSKQLGIPTANLPVDDKLTPWIANITSGVYFGWASLRRVPQPLAVDQSTTTVLPDNPTGTTITTDSTTTTATAEKQESECHDSFSEGVTVYPMVMSIGYNPFFGNKVRSAEVHILHEFEDDFYGAHMRLLITGFIRAEKNYPSQDALIADINLDCEVARRSLGREAWSLRETGKGTLDGSWLVRETTTEE